MTPEQQMEDMAKKLDDALRRIEDFEQWKTTKEAQQLSYPLDYVSQQIIAGIQPGFTGTGTYTTFSISNGVITSAS